MKSTEFCYWLQGLFEINKTIELNPKQTELVKKHLKMVFVHEKENSQHFDFCKGLYGYLSYSDIASIDESTTIKMKTKLDSLFEHVVNQYSPNTNHLSQINNSETCRC